MTNVGNRHDLRRKLREVAKRHVVRFDRALDPLRRRRAQPMRGDLLRLLRRLEAKVHIRNKRKRPLARKPRRIFA